MSYQDRRIEEIPPHSMFHIGILSINIFTLDSKRIGHYLLNNLKVVQGRLDAFAGCDARGR